MAQTERERKVQERTLAVVRKYGGYVYKNSLSFINGKFVGLVLDVKADADWKARTDKWLESIRADFGFTY